jgi:hypothetical protein|tara:strand:+ start:36361 stop:36702 length:342 start_codon:yes stop_codon:yes gene_type:complete
VKTIVKKVIRLETKRHDFDNDFAYIEVWRNNTLTDCYLAEKQYLWPDGSLKKGGIKYFYASVDYSDPEKEIKPLNCSQFDRFDCLFYLDGDGSICQIDSESVDSPEKILGEVN